MNSILVFEFYLISMDKIILRIKEGFDLENNRFVDFLNEAYKSFPR